jgi:hypothetical protein
VHKNAKSQRLRPSVNLKGRESTSVEVEFIVKKGRYATRCASLELTRPSALRKDLITADYGRILYSVVDPCEGPDL